MAKAVRAMYRKSLMDDPRHLMRWMKAQAVGGSPEEAAKAVAKSEGITVQTARNSILEVDAYRRRNDRSEFDLAIREFVISTIPQAKKTLQDLLVATEMVEIKNAKTGKVDVVKMDDKVTRLEAERVFRDLIIGLQPKVPPVEVNVNQTNQTANITNAGETFEERLSRLRKQAQAHNLLPPEVVAVPEYIDQGGHEDEDDGEEDEDED